VNTTPEQLQAAERDEFLEWRRCLATLQEVEGVLLTPYEKNLEFWRQLWRVVERR
jgi:large subunit GTPase 1